MKQYIQYLSLASAIAALSITIWLGSASPSSQDIRFVRSSDLLYGYSGMKEAQEELAQHQAVWQSNLDTLQNDFHQAMDQAKGKEAEMSEREQALERQKLIGQQTQLQQYASTIQEKALEQEQALLDGVLHQINSFVESYAKEKGYDMVIGTTKDGNLLYAEDDLDITDDLLKALNQNYRGE